MQVLKEQIRAGMRQRLAELTSHERAQASEAIRRRVVELPAWRDAGTLLLFWPRLDEPIIEPLFALALEAGKTLAFPAYDAQTEAYVARQFTMLPTEMIRGRFGIVEPAPSCPLIPMPAFDFALVPGLAFERSGVRLGRGRGFYDRLLEGFRGHVCGVGFAFQEQIALPAEPHDRSMDTVIFG